jgi:hypothetical protein
MAAMLDHESTPLPVPAAAWYIVRIGAGHGRQCIMRDEDGDTPLHGAMSLRPCSRKWKYCYESAGRTVYERDYEELTPVQRCGCGILSFWARM